MPIRRFEQWLPDEARLGSRGMPDMQNALPGPTSYKPMPSHAPLTDALGAYCRGAIDVRDKDLNVKQYAGDVDTLYELDGDSWSDVSLSGGYATATEERWWFQLWRNKILATNFSDYPQTLEIGGTNFANLTTDFKARQLAVVNQHVVAANTYDGVDGNVPDRVRWSAYEDETDWTVSPVTGADYRDMRGGPLRRAFGGEYGVILGDHTYRMDWEGAPRWFRIVPTIPGVGTIAPGACAQRGNTVFSLSQQGFVAIQNGSGQPMPIGAGRVDNFIFGDLDQSYLYRMSCVVDPRTGRVFWAYPGAGNTAGQPNKIIVYDSGLDKWAQIEVDTQLLWRAGGVGFTLEQLDTVSASVDDLPVSLDSSQWKGDSSLILAAFDGSNMHGFFGGTAMTATFVSREEELHEGHRTLLSSWTPLIEGGTVTARVGYRNSLSEDITWVDVLKAMTADGRLKKRVRARYHSLEHSVAGSWVEAIGIQFDDIGARRSGRRGG